MASSPASGMEDMTADVFVVCMMKTCEDCLREAQVFVKEFEGIIREKSGKVQMRSDYPKEWLVIDGKDNLKAPNHLNPACFDCDVLLVAAFPSSEALHTWWASNEVFALVKSRTSIAKMGIFAVDGLQQAYDVADRNKITFGDKFILLELIKMQAFKPVQHYVDCYKRYSEKASHEIGVECNLLFAEGVSGTLMSEFPLEAVCASAWRVRQDAHFWYDSDLYQKQLLPLRSEYSMSLCMIVPIFEDRSTLGIMKRAVGERNVLAPLSRK